MGLFDPEAVSQGLHGVEQDGQETRAAHSRRVGSKCAASCMLTTHRRLPRPRSRTRGPSPGRRASSRFGGTTGLLGRLASEPSPHEPVHPLVVMVERKQFAPRFHGVGGDPDVVRRYRLALRAKSRRDTRVAIARRHADRHDFHQRASQERPEFFDIPLKAVSMAEAVEKLASHDRREEDARRGSGDSRKLPMAPSQLRVGVRIEKMDSHSHIDSSMTSKSATARSNSSASSAVQVPMR